jgi:phytoene synthase
MTPQEFVLQKAAASGSSFYYAFLFLPPPRRQAITAFYAFCRAVDDVVDESNEPDIAQTKLAWWRLEVKQAFAGQPQHPIMQALMPGAQTYGLRAEQLLAVIDGCQMDLNQTRYLDRPALERYAHLVAGVVGEVSAHIFGQAEVATTAYAHRLGLAFQWTNILRDVGEDALRGRIYLPIEDLQRHDVRAHEIIDRLDSDRFRQLMLDLCRYTHGLYDEALALLPTADRRAQKPGLMMCSIYRTLLVEIEQAGFPVLRERVALTPLRKFWLAWKMQALGRF